MKKGYIKRLIISFSLIVILILSCFFPLFDYNSLIFFLLSSLVIIYYLFGYKKNKQRYQKDVILIILIYSVCYIILTYLLGIKVGFNKSGFNLSLQSIIENIVPIITIIVVSEFIRYMLITKATKYKFIIILTTIILILLDISLAIPNYDFKLSNDMIRFTLMIIIPSISKNILLSYISVKVGYKPTILYRFIFELKIYILPFFPDYGLYIDSLFNLLFPVFLTYIIYNNFEKLMNKEILSNKKNKLKPVGMVIISITLLIIIILTSGLFKYYALTIGSESMRPSINKGDVLMVKKLNKQEMNDLNAGNLLVFKYENRIIVHRIIRIIQVQEEYFFYTKGDNNPVEDGYPIVKKDIIGIAFYKIPYIGYPTVLINELLY